MATPITFAGSTVSISDDIPATYDEAGFEAVGVVFTAIGEVTSIGGKGRTYNDVSYTNLATRGTVHKKGSYDESELAIEIGVDRADAGQVILKAASDSDANHSFKIAYSNGEVDYFQALTFSFADAGGDADTIRAVTATLRIDYRGVVQATT
mgnify:CR=1 FL=1|tara:strand:+ start:1467 stop:1922 length:456 start_codon:yes stop_codon:yes gene_type:complete